MECSGVSRLGPIDVIRKTMAQNRKRCWESTQDGTQGLVPWNSQANRIKKHCNYVFLRAQFSQTLKALNLLKGESKLRFKGIDHATLDGNASEEDHSCTCHGRLIGNSHAVLEFPRKPV